MSAAKLVSALEKLTRVQEEIRVWYRDHTDAVPPQDLLKQQRELSRQVEDLKRDGRSV